ncbi:hypothetical protein ACGF8B_40230 [Streptomyces sp. NPDC047917]|uniref:hypothetical protein n=1 Tax=Streptomyces sp. NPDC047917 TaxID=3365491 RepID=UPI00371F22A8
MSGRGHRLHHRPVGDRGERVGVPLQRERRDQARQVEAGGEGRQQADVFDEMGAGEGPGADDIELPVDNPAGC